MNKLPPEPKYVMFNPLIDVVNSLLDRVAALEEAAKVKETPAILKPKANPAKAKA